MNAHNKHFHDKIRKFPSDIADYLFSWAIGRLSQSLKSKFKSAKRDIGVHVIEVLQYKEWENSVCLIRNMAVALLPL